eukprot:scaffold15890_cov65-Phaeocystis_antarctica.AAC.2
MVDANLQQLSGALHKDVSERSGLPADTFELYHGSKRLEGEAVLARWGVEKDSLIEVKTRGRGGMRGGGGGGGGADGGGGVEGGGGGTDSGSGGVGGIGGVGGVGSGSSSDVGGGGAGGVGSGSGIGGADSGLGVAGGGVGGGGDVVVDACHERTHSQDGKRPQNPKGKPLSPSKVDAEKQWLQNAKATAELEPEADRKALDDIVAVTASAARSGVEVQTEWLEVKERGIAAGAAAAQGISKGATLSMLPQIIIGGMEGNPKDEKQETQRDSTVGGEPSSIKALQIPSAQATSHGPSAPSPTSASYAHEYPHPNLHPLAQPSYPFRPGAVRGIATAELVAAVLRRTEPPRPDISRGGAVRARDVPHLARRPGCRVQGAHVRRALAACGRAGAAAAWPVGPRTR